MNLIGEDAQTTKRSVKAIPSDSSDDATVAEVTAAVAKVIPTNSVQAPAKSAIRNDQAASKSLVKKTQRELQLEKQLAQSEKKRKVLEGNNKYLKASAEKDKALEKKSNLKQATDLAKKTTKRQERQ